MTLPDTTNKHKELLYYLYRFRFLHTKHFQKLCNHKDPHRVKEWLSYLTNNGFITMDYSRKTVAASQQPAIYSLAPKARHILKENKKCEIAVLQRIYKEKTRTERFIKKCLFIADMYLFFLAQKKQDEELSFFTESMLTTYDFFPEELPSAYIVVKKGVKTRRYFLEVFDALTSLGRIRYKFRSYLEYRESGEWEANAGGEKFPALLFVFPSERIKKHIAHYAKAIFEKEYEEKLHLFLTTQERIHLENKLIWEKV